MGAKIIYRTLFFLLTAILLYSIYGIVSYYTDGIRNEKALDEMRQHYYAQATPASPQETPVHDPALDRSHHPAAAVFPLSDLSSSPSEQQVQQRFHELLQINEDIVGWVKIGDTGVDYPIMQSEDNDFYLERDILKMSNVNGSIFMDYRNDIQSPTDKHLILYGHNMKNQTMFAPLLHYESRWYLEQNPVIEFDTLYENRKWEIFAVNKTDIHRNYIRTDFINDDDFLEFITDLKKTSIHQTDIQLREDDVILTLSTCSSVSDEARFVVHARLIKPSADEA